MAKLRSLLEAIESDTFLEATPPPFPQTPPPIPNQGKSERATPPPIPEHAKKSTSPPPLPNIVSISEQAMGKIIAGLGKLNVSAVKKSDLVPLAQRYKELGTILERLATIAA